MQVYRDTAGISRELYRKVLAMPERGEFKGKRDYALLRLLWDNVLRRGEVAKANIGDFDAEAKTHSVASLRALQIIVNKFYTANSASAYILFLLFTL